MDEQRSKLEQNAMARREIIETRKLDWEENQYELKKHCIALDEKRSELDR